LVEDDQFLSRALRDKLERAGFLVTILNNGNEVLSQIKREKPDLLLLDIMMPGKNGFDVIEEIKLGGEFKKIPIIIISNLGQEIDIKKWLGLGVADYIVKSDLSISGVVEKVKECLTKRLVKPKK